jgi:hypothetical protein
MVVGLIAAVGAGGIAQASASTRRGATTTGCPAARCAAAAAVRTVAPVLVRSTSATLGGVVFAHGAETSVYFQYGSGATLTERTRASRVPLRHRGLLVRVPVTGLAQGTKYRFRIVLDGHSGASYGALVAFSTSHISGARGPASQPASQQKPTASTPGSGTPFFSTPTPDAPPSSAPESGGPTSSAREVLWGAEIGPQFTGTQAPWDMNAVTDFQRTVGKAPSIVAFNLPFEECASSCSYGELPTKQLSAIRGYGAIPMLNWASMSSPLAVDEPSFRLANVANGTFDEYIRSFALAVKAWGHPMFLRFNWEMNGDWFPWAQDANGNQPADYVAAWRHVHDIFVSVGATNVTWVWCPTVDPNHEFGSLAALYPGTAYVDWTCLDGYNFGTLRSPHGWSTFKQTFSTTYEQIVEKIAPDKPLMIGEVASSEHGGSKGAWITEMFNEIANVDVKVQAVVWFDWAQEGDWPIETSPASTAAFSRGISSSTFTTNTFGDLGPGIIQPPEPSLRFGPHVGRGSHRAAVAIVGRDAIPRSRETACRAHRPGIARRGSRSCTGHGR